jgi:hypothetical protein
MAKFVTVKCNRCDETITSNFSILKFVAGELHVQHDEDWDLCQACTGDLLDWISTSAVVVSNTLSLQTKPPA